MWNEREMSSSVHHLGVQSILIVNSRVSQRLQNMIDPLESIFHSTRDNNIISTKIIIMNTTYCIKSSKATQPSRQKLRSESTTTESTQ
jgi:hypothetical protein